MASDQPTIPEHGVLTLSEQAWAEAQRRARVIAPLAAMPTVDRQTADEAAAQLGLSRRQIYTPLQRFRRGDGLVTDLAPRRSPGGKGRSRLDPTVEVILREAIHDFYLARPSNHLHGPGAAPPQSGTAPHAATLAAMQGHMPAPNVPVIGLPQPVTTADGRVSGFKNPIPGAGKLLDAGSLAYGGKRVLDRSPRAVSLDSRCTVDAPG